MYELINLLYTLNDPGKNIIILGVKNNSNYEFNNMADNLAKRCCFHGSSIGMPVISEWNDYYKNSIRTKDAFYGSIHSSLAFSSWFNSKIKRFNHTLALSHLYKINKVRSPLCSCDNTFQVDVNHFLNISIELSSFYFYINIVY